MFSWMPFEFVVIVKKHINVSLFTGGHTVSARAAEPACSLECKQLTTKDYTDLLWTTVAEFPGE